MVKNTRHILLIVILFWISGIVLSSHPDKPLYQNPTYQYLERLVYVFSDLTEKPLHDDHRGHLINILITAFLEEHPKEIDNIIAKFNSYPKNIKVIFATALVATKGPKILEDLKYALPSKKQRVSIQDVKESDLVRIRQSKHPELLPDATDFLWAAFEGTGKEEHLLKILKYLVSENKRNKEFALEFLHRSRLAKILEDSGIDSSPVGVKELKEKMDELHKTDPECSFALAVFYSATFWSMEAQRNQNADVETKVARLIKKDPKLDYRE